MIHCSKESKNPSIELQQEYQVYSAVIDSLCSRSIFLDDYTRKILITRDSTSYEPFGKSFALFELPIKRRNYNDTSKIERYSHGNIFTFFIKRYPEINIYDMSNDFKLRNNNQIKLNASLFKTKISVMLFANSRIFEMMSIDKKKNKKTRVNELLINSNGILYLSRVGFDHDRKHAILYYWHSSFSGGSEHYILLEKVQNKWKILSIMQEVYV